MSSDVESSFNELKTVTRVRAELERAQEKHPRWPSDLGRQLLVVSEEMGEAVQAGVSLMEYEDTGVDLDDSADRTVWHELNDKINNEMIQVAAMALRFLMNRTVR
jgi:hypothetical protein